VSFAIANNLLALNTKAIDLRISPRATATTCNNFENLKDGFFGMKHHERYSITIPENPPKDKWGVMAKSWANVVTSKTKVCSN
jgi:hypothetical protein